MNTFLPAASSPSTCLPAEEDRLLSTPPSEETDEKLPLHHWQGPVKKPLEVFKARLDRALSTLVWWKRPLPTAGCLEQDDR